MQDKSRVAERIQVRVTDRTPDNEIVHAYEAVKWFIGGEEITDPTAIKMLEEKHATS
jgi:hypothetical protein